MSVRRPTKAMVLAAGFGTRMLPLSNTVPKALAPLWGKPMLEHTLTLLRSWGVTDVLINAHHLPNDILHFALSHQQMGLRIQISFEPDILGTGGALRKAGWFLDEDPFWLINADIAADLSPAKIIEAHKRGSLATLWLHPKKGPRTVAAEKGRIVDFRSDKTKNTCTFCGLHLLSPRILDYLPGESFAGIIPAYEKAIKAGERVNGICVRGAYWADVGKPEEYLAAHEEALGAYKSGRRGKRFITPESLQHVEGLKRKGVKIDGFAAIGKDVLIEKGARLRNAVLWDGAHVFSQADISNAVIGKQTHVRGKVTHLAMRADQSTSHRERDAIRELGWDPERMTLQPLSARGSARDFFRLSQHTRRMILIRYSLDREENALYARHARFLDSLRISVPEVLAEDTEGPFILMQDIGDEHLSDRVASQPLRETEALYQRILEQLLVFHEKGYAISRKKKLKLSPPFGPALWKWEHQLFADQYLKEYLGLPRKQVLAVTRELGRLARSLEAIPPVLVHRDLQSSNILLRGEQPYFIDFQGMRYGPAVYDLASLLCDPYVMLPLDLQQRLLANYAARSRHAKTVNQLFWIAAIQRLLQAMGAYVRLGRMLPTARFLDYIPRGRDMLLRALRETGGFPGLRSVLQC